MRTLKFTLLICVIIATGACGECEESAPVAEPAPTVDVSTPEESAATAISAMLAVAEAGDWGAYVDRFYGEKDKFTSDADRDQVVARFAEKWGAKVTEALKAAAGVTPRIEDGKAIFEVDGKPVFVLHEGPGGNWTFHL